ncbi:MAG: hypothetical protein JJV97_00725 [SAR324 cluster bacterium]|nr:hypothetical protein [SAR324 cluster bacterium]
MNPLNQLTPSVRYPLVFQKILKWATSRSQSIAQRGAWLTPEATKLALKLGVKEPDKIRIYSAHDAMDIGDEALSRLLKKFGFSTSRTCGITLFHSIAMNPYCNSNLVVLAHELRHVAQFEACGSLEFYLNYYLMEVGYFGYGKGPLEVDAQLASTNNNNNNF